MNHPRIVLGLSVSLGLGLGLGASLTAFGVAAHAGPLSGTKYSADKVIQHTDQQPVELIGNAKIDQGDKELMAEKIILNLKTGAAKAEGNPHFTAVNMTVDFSGTANTTVTK